MSDKNRNMNDINDQKTAEQQAFSEEIRRRLAAPDSGKPTLEEFKLLVYKDREKRRKKRNTLVACLVAAFIVGFISFNALVPEVGADKNPKETIQIEDGVIIKDGGYGSSKEDNNIWLTEDWRQVKDAKELYPELLIPTYMPEGFKFDSLNIQGITQRDYVCRYCYADEDGEKIEIEAVIIKSGEERVRIESISNVLCSEKGEIYVVKDEQNKVATIYIDDGIIMNIWYDVSDNEIVSIVDGIEL